MRILVIKLRNIGDTLLVSPLLENLSRSFENCIIDFLINSDSYEILELNPYVKNIFCYERLNKKEYSFLSIAKNEIQFFSFFYRKSYDIVINLTEGDRGAIISLLTKSPKKIGYRNKNFFLKGVYDILMPPQLDRHTVECNLDPMNILNLPILTTKVSIFFDQEDLSFIRNKYNLKGGIVHIHPVSRWMFKSISAELFAQIIDFIELSLNLRVFITASPLIKEIEEVGKIISLCKSNPSNLAGLLTIKQTAALNSQAKLFLGVDTAIMHISAANNVPVIAFFGPSGAHHWGPWDNSLLESGYLKKNGNQIMGLHSVISENRICQPCGNDGCNGSKISDCLLHFKMQRVQEEIIDKLNITKDNERKT